MPGSNSSEHAFMIHHIGIAQDGGVFRRTARRARSCPYIGALGRKLSAPAIRATFLASVTLTKEDSSLNCSRNLVNWRFHSNSISEPLFQRRVCCFRIVAVPRVSLAVPTSTHAPKEPVRAVAHCLSQAANASVFSWIAPFPISGLPERRSGG